MFSCDGFARLDDGSGSKAYALFIDFRLADATSENWLDRVGNFGSKKGDVVCPR
jgi:hypothetical protein